MSFCLKLFKARHCLDGVVHRDYQNAFDRARMLKGSKLLNSAFLAESSINFINFHVIENANRLRGPLD